MWRRYKLSVLRLYCICVYTKTTFWPNNQDFPLIFTSFCVLLGTKTAALRRLYVTAGLSEFLQLHRRADLKVMVHRGGDHIEYLVGTEPDIVENLLAAAGSPEPSTDELVVVG